MHRIDINCGATSYQDLYSIVTGLFNFLSAILHTGNNLQVSFERDIYLPRKEQHCFDWFIQ